MNQFTVHNVQFTISSQFSIFTRLSAEQMHPMKTVNCKLKITTTKGVA